MIATSTQIKFMLIVHPFLCIKKQGGVTQTTFVFIVVSAPGILPEGVIYYLLHYPMHYLIG